MTAAITDDDIRQELRALAMKSVKFINSRFEQLYDPDGAATGKELHAKLGICERAIAAWAKTLAPEKDAGDGAQETEAQKYERLARLVANPPPLLQKLFQEQGYERTEKR